uniref:DUF2541 family protein n=1 Tax=Steinernema glaseri TaxID=37863 RepID=A0A1I7YNJ9_9BILA
MKRLICLLVAVVVLTVSVISQAPPDCSKAPELFELKDNRSILIDSFTAACPNFKGTQCIIFRGYITRIDNNVVRNASLTTFADKQLRLSQILEAYTKGNINRREAVFQVPMSNGWGTVQDLFTC